MPAEVRQLLNLLSVGVSFGLGSTSDILTCMGVSGFFNILLLFGPLKSQGPNPEVII